MASNSVEAEVPDLFFFAMDSTRKEEEEEEQEGEDDENEVEEEGEEDVDLGFLQWSRDRRSTSEVEKGAGEGRWPRRTGEVMLEGYVPGPADAGDRDSDGVARTKSLTDEDLDELKGCLDLGFGFSYNEIPELCSTLPALELCYSMSQRFLDEQQQHQRSPDRLSSSSSSYSSSGEVADNFSSPAPPPIANWKISSPGDNPDEVKARLKYWAQAVACTVRLCN